MASQISEKTTVALRKLSISELRRPAPRAAAPTKE
jgi:hypothetical protein